MTHPLTVVVLAGGESRRFGSDKLAAPLAGTTVLDHLLGSLPQEWAVIAVGEQRPTPRPLTWTREYPPGGGPLAGIAAGLALVTTDLTAVVAGDMPYAVPGLRTLPSTTRGTSTPCWPSTAPARHVTSCPSPRTASPRRPCWPSHISRCGSLASRLETSTPPRISSPFSRECGSGAQGNHFRTHRGLGRVDQPGFGAPGRA